MDNFIPHALLTLPRTATDYVRGINSKIVYKVNQISGRWDKFLPSYEGQKFAFDTNECSQLSGVNVAETLCNWLRDSGQFSIEAMKWFRDNGYIDENGSFAFSERFTGILSGTTIHGNSAWYFWMTAAKYGLLPRKDLNYTMEQSLKFSTQEAMCNDYYNKNVITQAMKDKALQSLRYLQINYEWIGAPEFNNQTPMTDIIAALKQSPVQIGVPVCLPGWNMESIPLCPRVAADHAITLYGQNPDGTWAIRDHYNPYNKTLPHDYFIPHAIKGVISPVTMPVDAPPTPPASLEADANKTPNAEELNYFMAMVSWLGRQVQKLLWKK